MQNCQRWWFGNKRHRHKGKWVITTYCTDLDVNLQDTDEENQNSSETISSIEWSFCNMLTPSEGHGPRSIRSLLDQRLVKLSARATVNRGPALLAIILKQCLMLKGWFYRELGYCSYLETSHVRTEERSKLSATSPSLTLVTELVIQHVRLYLDLDTKQENMNTVVFFKKFLPLTLLSISPCCSWTNLAEMAAM